MLNEVRDTVVLIILVAMLTFSQAYAVLAPRTYQIIDGVRAIWLFGGCELEYFTEPAQPVNILVLACPRMDMIRLWPLPVEQPWCEDCGGIASIRR